MVKYIFVLIFILAYIFCGNITGYSNTSPLWTHLTYMFLHASVLHLLFNSLAFINIFRALEKTLGQWTLSIIIITAGFALSFIIRYDRPIVGSSGLIYTMLGMYSFFLVKTLIKNRKP
jgi:membrane associated rhomboid family serine protease